MTTAGSKGIKGNKPSPSFAALLDIFSRRHVAHRHNRLKAAETFIAEFTRMRRSVNLDREPRLNVFERLSFGNNEVALSSLLSWLLNERSSHYHGNLFLTSLVNLCQLPLPSERLTDYRVSTEFGGQEAIIDIMVYKKPDFLLYIENKVLSSEGDDQTHREFRDMRRIGVALGIPEERQFPIFMTPAGRTPLDRVHWHPLSLTTLSHAYIELGERIRSVKLRHLLDDLHEISTHWSLS